MLTLQNLFLLLAVILFVLAAVNATSRWNLLAIGLAFFAVAFLAA